jgi:hypothetical protein
MKAKKPLLLIAFILILVVLVVGITGLASAAPKPLDSHQATPVVGHLTNGGMEGVDWFFDWANTVVDGSGNVVSIPVWLIYQLDGTLQGTYRMDVVYTFAPPGTPHYLIEGQATFTGQIMGRRTSWVADVKGSGDLDPGYSFTGTQGWVSTITSSASPLSHMRGDIAVHDVFGYPDGSGVVNSTTYSGTLIWEPGQKK